MTCPKNCEHFIDENYKFYFAFENTLCIDYISEKLFKVLKFNIIPVVFSGADVSRFLPDKSYIDANSFASAEELAKYLKFVSENQDEFVKYFWWKEHYDVKSHNYYINKGNLCKICEKINEPNRALKRQIYSDMREWFLHDTCFEPKIKF